ELVLGQILEDIWALTISELTKLQAQPEDDHDLRLAGFSNLDQIIHCLVGRLRVIGWRRYNHVVLNFSIRHLAKHHSLFDRLDCLFIHRAIEMSLKSVLITGCSEGGIGYSLALEWKARK